MFMKKIFYISLFIVFHFYSKEVVLFVHPSTIFGIPVEIFCPAIQNIILPGWHEINEESLHKSCYEEVFLPFKKKYNIYFRNNPASFYMFNWSASIYPLEKKKIASEELASKIIEYKKKNFDDTLILIGCSHGGSVILGIADILKKKNIKIEKVILIGTPINEINNKNAAKKLCNGEYIFSKIINIYSESDYIQRIDLIFNNFKLCNRTLDTREGIINYKITDVGHINLWHKILWKDPFIINLPGIMYELWRIQ
jgi:hypothetical protein